MEGADRAAEAERHQSTRRGRLFQLLSSADRPDTTASSSSGLMAASRFSRASGILGTESLLDVHRVVAEVLGRALGEMRCDLGQYFKESTLDVCLGRKPDDSRHDSSGTCRRHGWQAKIAGDRGQRPLAASPSNMKSRMNVSFTKGRRKHDACAGCATCDSTGRQIRWPRTAR